MKNFNANIVMFGFGAVGQSVLRIFEKEFSFDKKKLTIIDRQEQPYSLDYRYIRAELTPGGHEKFFSPFLASGDILLDFSSETDPFETLKWCYDKGIRYLNTGDNDWAENGWKSMYDCYLECREFVDRCRSDAPTIVLHHGANPGSVSHFAKKAVSDIAYEVAANSAMDGEKLMALLAAGKWGELARCLEVTVIQSSDCDTQRVDPRLLSDDVFYSTWNPQTFLCESSDNAMLRLGKDERVPAGGHVKCYVEQDGFVLFDRRATECFVPGWTPAGKYEGMVIGHEEIFTISDCFSAYDENGEITYRPTVYFSYLPSDAAVKSLREVTDNDYREPEKFHLVKKGIVSGTEYVGVLVTGNRFKSRWVGNCISLDKIKNDFPEDTPTILQVAIPAVAGIRYIVENPNEGINHPDDLPYDSILATMEKYTGKTISVTSDFSLERDPFRFSLPLMKKMA